MYVFIYSFIYLCLLIFCSRTVILQLLVVQVVWFLLQFLCLRCIARSAYVKTSNFAPFSQSELPDYLLGKLSQFKPLM